MNTETFVPIKKMTLVNQVMERIKDLISSGAYRPGDKIPTETELATLFGVGRSSIRETIKIFNHLGVLESKSAIGTFVCERQAISREALTWALILGNDSLEAIIDLRAAMELWCFLRLTESCREAGDKAASTLAELHSILVTMSEAVGSGDSLGIVNADYDFHGTIIQAGANALFIDFYNILRSFLLKEIAACQATYSDWSMSVKEHEELIAAAASGDIGIAENAYQKHIRNVKNLLRIPRGTS